MERRKRKLKIAQIAPIIQRVPPKRYGGTERIVFELTEALVNRGHDVTLFASGDSITSAKLVSVYPRSLREAKIKDLYGLNDLTMLHIGTAYGLQEQFDIIHDHNATLSLATANIATTPVVMTLHGPFTTMNRMLFNTLRKPYLIPISHSQAKSAPEKANISRVVYNGLNMDHYPFSADNDGYLLFVGRISMEKGTHHAIEVAQALNLPLIIAAKLDTVDKQYFHQYIEPLLSDPDANQKIQWVGEVNEEERNRLMSRALCILHPVTWKEPFGLTMIEAMACGCPVIAFNEGSIPEIVKDGETGFVVDDVNGMIEAVENISSIDRLVCRTYALGKFSASKMTDNYEAVYYHILQKGKRHETAR